MVSYDDDDNHDPVYFKIIRSSDDNRKHLVACLQSFDECDYDQSRFLSQTKYKTEEEAQAVIDGIKMWLAENMLGL